MRGLAVLLGFVVAFGQASTLHGHDYVDHDHPEHHQGLAGDHHHGPGRPGDDKTTRLESCTPGRHIVVYEFVCASVGETPGLDTEVVAVRLLAPAIRVHFAPDLTDVRVHGPPAGPQTSPRPPPPITAI